MITVTEYITCDECHANDASELRFHVNGRPYAIDLCEMHRAVFDTLIQPYISNGHPVKFNNHSVRKDAPPKSPVTTKPKRARKSRAKAVEAPTLEVQTLETEDSSNG